VALGLGGRRGGGGEEEVKTICVKRYGQQGKSQATAGGQGHMAAGAPQCNTPTPQTTHACCYCRQLMLHPSCVHTTQLLTPQPPSSCCCSCGSCRFHLFAVPSAAACNLPPAAPAASNPCPPHRPPPPHLGVLGRRHHALHLVAVDEAGDVGVGHGRARQLVALLGGAGGGGGPCVCVWGGGGGGLWGGGLGQ
jgi:hypothetical protein